FTWQTAFSEERSRSGRPRASGCALLISIHCGCDVDCHATNFHPSGVLVHTLRNLSRRLRGWPLISASIAAPPVMSAALPNMRTLRSVKLALLYLVLPEVIDSSQLALVSVMAEEWV